MRPRFVVWTAIAVIGLAGVVGGAWILSLPEAPNRAPAPPIGEQEAQAVLDALKPRLRARPVIAILGINDATETTDYLMPFGVLRRADVAEVVPLATRPGPVKLYPVLEVEPHATVAEFDARHPEGADYVIVPAMSRDDDTEALAWLKSQAAKGAMVVGVCAGAMVVAEAGLLDGKRATTHWYFVEKLRERHPGIRYVADRRVVVDGGVATTTGVTASMPISLILIEAIAGREKADAVASDLGLTNWDARHDSRAFLFTRPFALTAIRNTAAFWKREQLGMELGPGMDEVSLALVADAWSRTYRSRAVPFARTQDPLVTRNGIRVIPDRVAQSWPAERRLPTSADQPPAKALDEALRGIEARYGARTARFVAMQLEYLPPELSQMVVGVKPGPAQPVGAGHGSEHRVQPPL
jgi:putative intracellular protease/amidase